MQRVHVIEDLESLRALSDPLRVNLMRHLLQRPRTGQQLADLLGVPRPRVHYHLKELEKHGLVRMVERSETKGVVQKFYRAVANCIIPSDDLLALVDEGSVRQSALEMLARTREQVLEAPEDSFQLDNEAPAVFNHYQFYASPEAFARFVRGVEDLFSQMREEDRARPENQKQGYVLSLVGFAVEGFGYDDKTAQR